MITLAGITFALMIALLARDTWGWLPRLSKAIIWLETAPLPAARRAIRREEWLGELINEYDDRRLTGVLWTIKLGPIALWERCTTPVSAFSTGGVHRDRRYVLFRIAQALTASLVMGLLTGVASAQALVDHKVPVWLIASVAAALIVTIVVARRTAAFVRAYTEQQRALRRVGTIRVLYELRHEPVALSLQSSRALFDAGHVAVLNDEVTSETVPQTATSAKR